MTFLIVLGTIGSTVMLYSTSNQQNASRSSFDNNAHGFAEAGINNAMAVLSNPSNNALVASTLPNSLATANTTTYDDGYVKWWGSLNAQTSTWTLNAVGYIRNPTGGMTITRTVTAQTRVRPSLMQPANNPSWNYILALRTGTASGCDMTLDNSVNVQSPLYVMGNLCLNTPSQVTGGPLVVGGALKLDVNTNVGSTASPVSEVHVRNGCSYKGSPYHSPCGAVDNVYSAVADNAPPPITPPTADFTAWYTNSAPGPRQGCTVASGTVPVFDTGDGVMNNSVPGVFNLTPGSSDYSCVVKNGNNGVVGQLTWDHTAKTLTIAGTVFIDGSVIADYGNQNVPVQYNGQGTLYLGGTFYVSNTKLCGGIANGTCDFNAWNPNTEMLVVVANGNGGQVPSGDGILVKNSFFQGALWATNTIELDTSSQSEGPMIAGTEILGQSVYARSWPLITTIPAGAPGTLTIYAQPDPPTNYLG